jgi:hypothetical protein
MDKFEELVETYGKALAATQKTNEELHVAVRKLVEAKDLVIKTLGPPPVQPAVANLLCVVCMERPRARALNCGHFQFCSSCCARILIEGRCPTCRGVVHRSFRVYT